MTLWREALESQVEALRFSRRLRLMANQHPEGSPHKDIGRASEMDRDLLELARPYAWTRETSAAVWEAARTVPLDTRLHEANLDTGAAWWFFEEPLGARTVTLIEGVLGVRALLFGWRPMRRKGPRGLLIKDRYFYCVAWVDSPVASLNCPVCPTQTWTWESGETISSLLVRSRHEYNDKYGPGGVFEHQVKTHIGVENFVTASDLLSRFLAAGLVWLQQRVLVLSSGNVDRGTRKLFARETGQQRPSDVKVIELRRTERAETAPGGGGPVEWSCRWVVDGHWRNQACGPGWSDHRLTWIHPYVKGPDGKPLRFTEKKVYAVRR